MGFVHRFVVFSAVFWCLWTVLVVSHKEKMVVTAHVMLTIFSSLRVPAWICRAIVPSVGAGEFGGVKSVDRVVSYGNLSVPIRVYFPKTEKNTSSVFLWAHGGGFVLGRVDEVLLKEKTFGVLVVALLMLMASNLETY